jgi:hypothetical protein
MKYTWERNDIICGRIICKKSATEAKTDDLGWYAKHTYKIGWLAAGNPEKDYYPIKGETREERERYIEENRADYCLIAMMDGMISSPQTKCEMTKFLSENGYMPAPHSHVMKIMEYLRDSYETKFL